VTQVPIDYGRLAATRPVEESGWDAFVRELLVPVWLDAYEVMTPWPTEVLEIAQGDLTYLFDAPSLEERSAPDASDRVVAAWGRSCASGGTRDRARLGGFLPGSDRWSHAGRDRGHLVAHALGGGLDLNLIPQARDLNRGSSLRGRRWREMERRAAARTGTPLFVRPIYGSPSWEPDELEYGLLVDGRLSCERFANTV
jgi:hypothetical protein